MVGEGAPVAPPMGGPGGLENLWISHASLWNSAKPHFANRLQVRGPPRASEAFNHGLSSGLRVRCGRTRVRDLYRVQGRRRLAYAEASGAQAARCFF